MFQTCITAIYTICSIYLYKINHFGSGSPKQCNLLTIVVYFEKPMVQWLMKTRNLWWSRYHHPLDIRIGYICLAALHAIPEGWRGREAKKTNVLGRWIFGE